MRPALELTSVPKWATAATRPHADITGRYWTLVALGDEGADAVRFWCDEISVLGRENALVAYRFGGDDVEEACAAIVSDAERARVGWRLMMAGPATACLRLRAKALDLGLADDEMTIASTEVERRAVYCVHCRTVTSHEVKLEETVTCRGCGRTLLVYYHISRRQGAHLGFMVDAEQVAP